MRQVRKMGPLQGVLGMMPGLGKQMKQIRELDMDERELDRLEAIILSMTPAERANPSMIDGSRRKRIAQGSGTTIQAVNQLVKQFGQMKKMMSQPCAGQDARPGAADEGDEVETRRERTRSGASRRFYSSPLTSRAAMVRIRLRRVGSRKNPIWRVVVADRRSPRDGRTIETIGHYNPQTDPSVIVIDEERARHWLDHGAQPTRTVATLLRTKGIAASGT